MRVNAEPIKVSFECAVCTALRRSRPRVVRWTELTKSSHQLQLQHTACACTACRCDVYTANVSRLVIYTLVGEGRDLNSLGKHHVVRIQKTQESTLACTHLTTQVEAAPSMACTWSYCSICDASTAWFRPYPGPRGRPGLCPSVIMRRRSRTAEVSWSTFQRRW